MKIIIIIITLLTYLTLLPNAYCNNFLSEACNYTVKIKAKSQYPFAETEDAGIRKGAGFIIDKKKSYILINAHVSGRGDTKLKLNHFY